MVQNSLLNIFISERLLLTGQSCGAQTGAERDFSKETNTAVAVLTTGAVGERETRLKMMLGIWRES